jgi:hypothetical protein
VFRTAGRYAIVGNVRWDAHATGKRITSILFNSTTTIAEDVTAAISGATISQSVPAQYDFAQWDYIELIVEQNRGGALDLKAVGNHSPELSVDWLGVGASSGSSSGADFAQVVTVAKSGGDYLTIQGALDSITDNDSTTRYLVLVHPGLYVEQVTMKSYVDVRGIDRSAVQIEYGATTGAVIMADNCEISNLTIELSATEGHWGIVSANKSGIHMRSLSLLSPFGSSNRGAGIKITGTSWGTCFIENVIINTYTQTNQGIFVQSDGVDLVDTTLNDVFVDALEATSGGAVLIDGCEDIHLRNVYSRVASAAYGLRVIAGSVVDVTSCYFEAGTESIEVDASTVYLTGTPITNSSTSGSGVLSAAGRGVIVTKSAQSIGNSSDTAISFTSALFQYGNRYVTYWVIGSPTRVTMPHAGFVNLSARVVWAANATGARYAHLKKNGTDFLSLTSQPAMAAGGTYMMVPYSGFLEEDDYIEVVVQQQSGGNLNVDVELCMNHSI